MVRGITTLDEVFRNANERSRTSSSTSRRGKVRVTGTRKITKNCFFRGVTG